MPTSKFRYLYVDDDRLSREVMKLLMDNFIGVKQLTIFEDSEDFISRIKANSPYPDFIFLDIHIEPNNGYQLLRMIRNEPELRGIKVIAVTASIMKDEMKKLKTKGFDGAIAKPLDSATFPDLISRLEEGKEIWQEI